MFIEVLLGLVSIFLIYLIGYSITLLLYRNNINKINLSQIIIFSAINGIFYLYIIQLLTFLLFGNIIISAAFIPVLSLIIKKQRILFRSHLSRLYNIIKQIKFMEVFHNYGLILIFIFLSLYIFFRILFFVPYASDDLVFWQHLGKILFFSDNVVYPTNISPIVYRTIDNIDLYTFIESTRTYPILLPMLFNFVHNVSFQFNLIGTKSIYLLFDVTTTLVIIDYLRQNKYSKKVILIILVILKSTPYYFIFITVGYTDGILGAFLLYTIYILFLNGRSEVYRKNFIPIFSLMLFMKIEGLYVYYIMFLGLIFFKENFSVKYIINLIIVTLIYFGWLFFTYFRTGIFLSFKTEGGITSSGNNSINTFITSFPPIDNFLYIIKFPLHAPIILLLIILTLLLYVKNFKKLSKFEIFLFLAIFTYIIPWAFIANPGSGPRPFAHLLPSMMLFIAKSVKILVNYQPNPIHTIGKFRIKIPKINYNRIKFFGLYTLVLIQLLLIMAAPLFIVTQFSNPIVKDDIYAIQNVFDDDKTMYGNVLHGTLESSFLLGEWINENIPIGSKIVIPRVEGGTHLLIDKQSVMINHLDQFNDMSEFLLFLKLNNITHIVFDSIFQYPSKTPFYLSESRFELLKYFKYNATIGAYQNQLVYSAVYEIKETLSPEFNITSNISIPTTLNLENVELNYTFYKNPVYSSLLIGNPFSIKDKFSSTCTNISVSINSVSLKSNIDCSSIEISLNDLVEGINHILIRIDNIHGFYIYPKLYFT